MSSGLIPSKKNCHSGSNEVCDLVPKPYHANVIGNKGIFKKKIDEEGNITRNKAPLVAQGYTQVKGIYFNETFAPVSCLESLRLLMTFACTLRFKLYQMDINGVFLNGYLNEELFVVQPKGFEVPFHLDHFTN